MVGTAEGGQATLSGYAPVRRRTHPLWLALVCSPGQPLQRIELSP